jgi:hypothetical protein
MILLAIVCLLVLVDAIYFVSTYESKLDSKLWFASLVFVPPRSRKRTRVPLAFQRPTETWLKHDI